MSAAEKEQALADEVLEDPYTREGLAILSDLSAASRLPLSASREAAR
jgi:hypothetical protein